MIFGTANVPFERPAAARPGYTPTSLSTGFISPYNPFPTVMQTPMASMPRGVRMPLLAEPGVLPAPAATLAPGVAAATRVRGNRSASPARVLTQGLLTAMGVPQGMRVRKPGL